MNRRTTTQSATLRGIGSALTTGLACLTVLAAGGELGAEVKNLATGGFEFEKEVVVLGAPEAVFDLFTGDISPWWDHHFMKKPKKLFIEPKPGGGFYEIFDAEGNGALHATVIFAERGKTLRMVGPLGLSGHPIDLVCSLDFEAAEGGRTRIGLTVRAAGQMQDGWAEAVEGAWNHFLIEQFKPYAESKLKP